MDRFKLTRSSVARGLVAMLLLFAAPAYSQMTIDAVVITSGPAYENGVFSDFFIEPFVVGSEIAAVSVSLTSGDTIDLVEVEEDEFVCDDSIPTEPCDGFLSLAQINAIGMLTFNVVGENLETDSWTVPGADYMPGTGQVGFPMILEPLPTQDVFAPGAPFVWAMAPSWVEAIQVDLVDLLFETDVDQALFIGNTVTSWTPGGVVAGNFYEFEITFADLFFEEDPRLTSQMRPFLFTSGFTAFNSKVVPEPTGGAVLAAAVGWLTVLCRRSRKRDCERNRRSASARSESARSESARSESA